MTFRRTPIALLIAIALLQGCGGGGDDAASPVPSPAPAPAPAPAPTPMPSPTAVGTPLGPVAASSRIGPAGGRLDAPDYGLAVIVPPGAFAAEQLVTLQPIEAKAPGALGNAWRVGPEGVNAAKPITLEWLPGSALRMGAANLRIATQGRDGMWRSSKAGSDDGERVRTRTTHFSDWSLVAGSQLLPHQAEVNLGQSLALSVVHCSRGNAPDNGDEQLHYPCSATQTNEYLTGWAVNGTPGGSSALGVLTGIADPESSQRSYVAPSSVPAVNPVAVSVDDILPDLSGQPTLQRLVSTVTVADPTAGCQWLRGVNSLDVELEMDYRWSGSDAQMRASYAHQVRVQGRLVRDPMTPIGSAWFSGNAESGSVKSEQQYQSLTGPDGIEVKGEGAPMRDAQLPLLRVFVNLEDCSLFYVGDVRTLARHVSKHPQGDGVLENKSSGLSFVVTDYVVAGRRDMGQERLLPVLMNRDGMNFVDPDSHHRFDGASGTARLRWSLKPR